MTNLLQLPLSYLLWHYVYAWADIVRLYKNFSWFFWNFFSIRLLSGTLFSPWKRLHEASKKESGGFLGSLILNLLLRFIGVFARIGTILFGLAALMLLTVAFVAFLALWLLLPAGIIVAVMAGVRGLMTF